jgi:ankyrin repeat protein
MVELIIPPPNDEFPDPHVMGKWTGLHQCVRQQNVEMMKILIENGANLEIKDVDGETPTFLVSSASAPEILEVLLDESERVRRGRLDMPHDGREGWRL